MIYCGHQGTGKSTYCREHPESTLDLDSSNFKKIPNWEKQYIAEACKASASKAVFISAHRCVIERLMVLGIPFEVLIPAENKQVWADRLWFRYHKNPIIPNLKAIRDFEQNYEKDMAFYKSLEEKGIKVHRIQAKVVTTISSFIQ